MCLFCRFLACLFIISIASANIGKKAAIVIDYTNGRQVLFADNPDAKRHPASITKVMTIYLLLDAIKNKKITLNTKFKVSKFATTQMPSKLNLKVGEKISVLDVIKALVVKSANDVAVVAAEGLSGSVTNFCRLMNQKSRQLGMNNTHFENPSGVPNRKQISSARDLAKLGMAIFEDFPQHWHFFSNKKFTFSGKTHNTHCKILHWYKGADGAKTGYICASGFNLLVTASKYSKTGEQKRLFVVVMGGSTGKARDLYAAQLMDKYLKGYSITPQKPRLKTSKKSLLEQVSKAEMLDKVIFEEEEVLVSNSKPVLKFNKLLDNLYKSDEDVVEE